MPSTFVNDTTIALCVDCDGSLIRTDLLHESAFRLLKDAPWLIFLLPIWLLRGKAHLKEQIAQRVSVDVTTLPLNEEVLAIAHEARAAGCRVVLATASHRVPAQALATHLGVFDEVLASDGGVNLSGQAKRARLVARFGERGFDYIGNERSDLAVWASARRAVVVTKDAALIRAAAAVTTVERVISPVPAELRDYLRGLRLHQWLKNLLVFVPLFAAHQFHVVAGLMQALLAFFSFSLCASAVYVLNDLFDLESDRHHIRKRFRPFASGLVPLWHGALLIPLLLGAALTLALLLPPAFAGVLAAYFVATLAYSIVLKRQVIVDVLMLAGLYTMRVIAGSTATTIVPSFWLLAFSMFLFLSLAMVKRYSELLLTLQQNKEGAAGRGYVVQDLPVLMSIGTGSGLVAVMVFALYINNPETRAIYAQPFWLWFVPLLLLYWVSRIWMKAHRGEVDDDPIVFALKDWQSVALFALSALFFSLA